MEIVIRRGDSKDAERFIRLLNEVRAGMEHKEWFYLDPPEFVQEALEKETMKLWVAMDGDQLAGAFDLLVPGLDDYNYGYDLDFSVEQLMKVVNMDSAAVYPAYRGQNLQQRLLAEAEKEISSWDERILLCTVHPENHYSLDNVLKQGYRIEKKLEKYDSVRYLLRKDIF